MLIQIYRVLDKDNNTIYILLREDDRSVVLMRGSIKERALLEDNYIDYGSSPATQLFYPTDKSIELIDTVEEAEVAGFFTLIISMEGDKC